MFFTRITTLRLATWRVVQQPLTRHRAAVLLRHQQFLPTSYQQQQQHRGIANDIKVTETRADDVKPHDGGMSEGVVVDREKEEEILELQTHVRLAHKHGDYSGALESSLKLLTVTQDHFGRNHPATATAYNNIGLMRKLLGSFGDSRKAYHEALRIYGDVVGKNHASYAAALHNLGNLNRSQVLLDDSLTSMERLQHNEAAMEYLQEALNIRQVELGAEHPHTVASRSNLGATIATQVIQQLSATKNNPSKLTKKQWEVAYGHLQASLQTAIENPRGKRISSKLAKNKVATLSAASAAQNLAVFIKCRSTMTKNKDKEDLMQAKQYYEAALNVRSQLLHEGHPDLVATKHSLAELLTVLGDEKGANKLRNEIIDAHDVKEVKEDEMKKDKASS